MSLVITNNDQGGIVHSDPEFQDGLVTAAGADVFAKGTILARSVASLKFILFVKGGVTDGNGVPKAILNEELTFTGAGDLPARPLISGEVRKEQLIIDADGDDSNIDAVVKDELRDFGIVALEVTELNQLDNQ